VGGRDRGRPEVHPGEDGGTTGIDNDYFTASFENIGAWIMGRNMFGPVRGPWPDDEWRGWWGDDPPYHCPVFVLTHHRRAPVEMEGGTTFHFVTDGVESAYEQAVAAAGDQDIRLGGGVATVQEYLRAGLVDDLHLAIAPVLLGAGERFFDHLEGATAGYECAQLVAGSTAMHVHLVRARRAADK
jgi:dihydrofolate reductase